jgi:hypothetical protein
MISFSRHEDVEIEQAQQVSLHLVEFRKRDTKNLREPLVVEVFVVMHLGGESQHVEEELCDVV